MVRFMTQRTCQPPLGEDTVVRPLSPADADALVRFGERLSVTSLYRRFFTPVRSLAVGFLRRLAADPEAGTTAFVLAHGDEIVGVAEYHRRAGEPAVAEFAVVVDDRWHRRGAGRALVRRLSADARERGVERLQASILHENLPALRMTSAQAPGARRRRDGVTVEVEIDLRPRRPEAGRMPAWTTSSVTPSTTSASGGSSPRTPTS